MAPRVEMRMSRKIESKTSRGNTDEYNANEGNPRGKNNANVSKTRIGENNPRNGTDRDDYE